MAGQTAKRQPRPVAKYIVADIVPARFHYHHSRLRVFRVPVTGYILQSILINGGPYLVDRGERRDRSTMGLRAEFTPLATLPEEFWEYRRR